MFVLCDVAKHEQWQVHFVSKLFSGTWLGERKGENHIVISGKLMGSVPLITDLRFSGAEDLFCSLLGFDAV
jgi:hypothetical protein